MGSGQIAQVQVVLHHLTQHLPPPVLDELFKLVRGQPGRLGGLQPGDQRGDQLHRARGRSCWSSVEADRGGRATQPVVCASLRYWPGAVPVARLKARAKANSES
jgi:hypothetical protein